MKNRFLVVELNIYFWAPRVHICVFEMYNGRLFTCVSVVSSSVYTTESVLTNELSPIYITIFKVRSKTTPYFFAEIPSKTSVQKTALGPTVLIKIVSNLCL